MEIILILVVVFILSFASFPSWLRKRRFAEAGACCELCGRRWEDGYMLYAHHKIPVCDGGEDTIENCEMLCRDCHSKRHRHLADWYRRNGEIKLSNKNAFASRHIKKEHNLMRLDWNG